MKRFISLCMTTILIFCLTGCSLIGCNPERNEEYTREVKNNEVIVEMQSNTLYFEFKVRPQINIDDLQITIAFYDKNNFPVGARTKDLGKVVAGNEYSIQFNSSDFTTKEMFAISKWKYLRARGTVRVEQEINGFCSKHNYDSGYISKPSTCIDYGERIYTCNKCNYKKSDLLELTEHNWLDCKYSDDAKFICDKCCIRTDRKD